MSSLRSFYVRLGCGGQASGWEFILACLLFFFSLTMAVLLWDNTIEKINNSEKFNDFEDRAVDVAEKLVRTPGIPNNWNRDNVESIGLADQPRVLNSSKVFDFLYLMNSSSYDNTCGDVSNYHCFKHLLGIGGYDFYLTLFDLNNSVIELHNTSCFAGLRPDVISDVEYISLYRTALLDDKIVRMEFVLWYNNTGIL